MGMTLVVLIISLTGHKKVPESSTAYSTDVHDVSCSFLILYDWETFVEQLTNGRTLFVRGLGPVTYFIFLQTIHNTVVQPSATSAIERRSSSVRQRFPRHKGLNKYKKHRQHLSNRLQTIVEFTYGQWARELIQPM
jgi:hypothetical protein